VLGGRRWERGDGGCLDDVVWVTEFFDA